MVYDEYISLKEKYKNSIVLIKVGNFYRTYDEDGIIPYNRTVSSKVLIYKGKND